MAQAHGLYVRVGVLILVGLALLVGFLLFLASGRFGVRAQVFETYLEESVQGLDIGTPVRFRGVAIGRITQIALVSSVYERPRGAPFAQAFQLVLVRFAIDLDRVGEAPSLEEAVRLGLRARIASQGITGVNYLELDFLPPDRYPPRSVPWEPRYAYVPSVPSTVAQVTSAAEALVARLQGIDFESLFTNLTGLVVDVRGEVSNGDLTRVLREAAETLTSLRTILQGADLGGTVGEIRAAATSVRGAGEAAEALVGGPEIRGAANNMAQAANELRIAMARLPQAVSALETTVRAARAATTDAQADLVPILRDLRAAASNLRDTTEMLRRSPSQALFGAPPPQDRR